MITILNYLITCLEHEEPAVIGAIITSAGSAPRDSGARMLVRKDGSLIGTIGGGALEGASIAAARQLLNENRGHRILDFTLTADDAARMGMICGGRQQVLLQRLDPGKDILSLLHETGERLKKGLQTVLLTVIDQAGVPHLQLYASELALPASIHEEIGHKIGRSNRPFSLKTDDLLVFVEPLARSKKVHLVGAGHVAQATARLATMVGFSVRVMDDRSEFANRDRFPEADVVEVLEDFTHCLHDLGDDDMVVIVTRGHLHDREVLGQALRTNAGYIGMIGSRSKRDATYAALEQEGMLRKNFARVHCPIGLDLGGDSPAEIALSIVAQLQQVRTGRTT